MEELITVEGVRQLVLTTFPDPESQEEEEHVFDSVGLVLLSAVLLLTCRTIECGRMGPINMRRTGSDKAKS
jgi:hypothetical protein